MKTAIHPKYYTKAKATCSCGATFIVGSTMPEIHVEICSKCHPFYTGKGKLIDTAGRVERFEKRIKARGEIARGSKKTREVKHEKRREARRKRLEASNERLPEAEEAAQTKPPKKGEPHPAARGGK